MLRGGLQDHLRRFTPPQILHTLDAFPSDQGKFRVSPHTLKELQAFLGGLCNFYWQFIKNYSTIA